MLTRDKKLEGGVTGQRGVEFFPIQFLSRVNRLTHDTDTAILSVCHLSVCIRPSRSGILWKTYCHSFYRAMLCISAVYAGTRCLSVRLSVTFVSCAKTNKDIFEIFSPFHHSSFSTSNGVALFRREPP